MGRWITFDRESTTAIAAATPFTPELHDAKPGANQDALGVALATNRDAVLLMPATDFESVIVAHIRRLPAAATLSERGPNPRSSARADSPRTETVAARAEGSPSPAIDSPPPTREPQSEVTSPAERTPVYEAGGFLGLRDVPVCDDEPPRPKRWWQKILD